MLFIFYSQLGLLCFILSFVRSTFVLFPRIKWRMMHHNWFCFYNLKFIKKIKLLLINWTFNFNPCFQKIIYHVQNDFIWNPNYFALCPHAKYGLSTIWIKYKPTKIGSALLGRHWIHKKTKKLMNLYYFPTWLKCSKQAQHSDHFLIKVSIKN
jgi:hypothetical protein